MYYLLLPSIENHLENIMNCIVLKYSTPSYILRNIDFIQEYLLSG